jgi:hypothetical protein
MADIKEEINKADKQIKIIEKEIIKEKDIDKLNHLLKNKNNILDKKLQLIEMLNQYNNLKKKDINNINEVNINYNIPFKRKADDLPSEDEEINQTKKKLLKIKELQKIYVVIKDI